MKKLLYLLLLTPIIYLTSCSSSPDLSPTNTSLHGTWQYDSWLYDGDELLNDYVSYLNICEDSGYWATQIFDIEGNMTSNSQAGSFTVNDDQTEGVFTVELVYEAINGWLMLDLPQTFTVSIYKLDDNELDFSFQYAGHTEIIESVKTPTEPTCSYTLAALDCMGVPNGIAAMDDCGDCHQAYMGQESGGPFVNIATYADTVGVEGMLFLPGEISWWMETNIPLWNAGCIGCADCYILDLFSNSEFFIGEFCEEDLIAAEQNSYYYNLSEILISGNDTLQPGFYGANNEDLYDIHCVQHE